MIVFVLVFSAFFYSANRLQKQGKRTIERTVRVTLERICECNLRA